MEYPWFVFASHLVCSIILFFGVNWIGSNARPMGYMQLTMMMRDDTAPLFNFLYKTLAPVVFLIIYVAIFQKLGLNILVSRCYMIIILYWAIRILYLIVMNRIGLINWVEQFLYCTVSVALAIWVNSVVKEVGDILPDKESLLEELWLLVIAFLYAVLNKLTIGRSGSEKRRVNYIENKYSQFNRQYGELVHSTMNNSVLEAIVFSVMIYEDFNRPSFARWIERKESSWTNKIHTYGVMQVSNKGPLTDEESVMKGMEIIKASIIGKISPAEDGRASIWNLIDNVAQCYNPGNPSYSCEIEAIYDVIKKHYQIDNYVVVNKEWMPENT